MKVLIILLVLSIGASSCGSLKKINYKYTEPVNTQLIDVVNELEKSNFSIRAGKKSKKIFALAKQCEEVTTIVFNYAENMPKSIQNLISRSRRMIRLNESYIPVIYYFDDGNSSIRTGGTSLGIIGGYLIQFDESGSILLKGPVY